MRDLQRIILISTQADADQVVGARNRIGKRAIVLTAPSGEAKRVVRGLGRDPVPEVILAEVRFPDVDRGHRLDTVVRRYALADRFRDVVVVADPATLTLLLRVLAPGQLPDSGPVTEVGLPRAARPVPLGLATVGGIVLALLIGPASTVLPIWLLPALVLVAGLALLPFPPYRHLGWAMLIALPIAAVVVLLSVTASKRFPAS